MTRFLHLSDLHISHPDAGDIWLHVDTTAQVTAAVEAIQRLTPAPDFVVVSGDITNMGDQASYDLVRQLLAPLDMPILMGLGNHDKRAGFHASFATQGGEAPHDHAALVAGVHVITLDSLIAGAVSGRLAPEQIDWLRATLQQYPDVPKLISVHHPPRVSGQELAWSTLDAASSEALAAALQGYQVLGILCGHVHTNRVQMWRGMAVYGTVGLNTTVDLLEPEDMHILEGTGFTLFDLYPAGLSATFIPLSPVSRTLGVIPAAQLRAFS